MQHIHDRKAGIKPDEIGQLKGSGSGFQPPIKWFLQNPMRMRAVRKVRCAECDKWDIITWILARVGVDNTELQFGYQLNGVCVCVL